MAKKKVLTFTCAKDAEYVLQNDFLYSDADVEAAWDYITK